MRRHAATNHEVQVRSRSSSRLLRASCDGQKLLRKSPGHPQCASDALGRLNACFAKFWQQVARPGQISVGRDLLDYEARRSQ